MFSVLFSDQREEAFTPILMSHGFGPIFLPRITKFESSSSMDHLNIMKLPSLFVKSSSKLKNPLPGPTGVHLDWSSNSTYTLFHCYLIGSHIILQNNIRFRFQSFLKACALNPHTDKFRLFGRFLKKCFYASTHASIPTPALCDLIQSHV